MSSEVEIEIVYVSQPIFHETISLKAGALLEDALKASKVSELFLSIQSLEGQVGIFGKVLPLNTPLKEGDRVEIYRALHQDPKEARRKRAKSGKVMLASLRYIP